VLESRVPRYVGEDFLSSARWLSHDSRKNVPFYPFCGAGMDARTPESKLERRRFATMPSELRRLSTWLQERSKASKKR
jgi:hypothetical protein